MGEMLIYYLLKMSNFPYHVTVSTFLLYEKGSINWIVLIQV